MTKKKSTRLCLEFRGGKIVFNIHAASGRYRKHYRGRDVYLGPDPGDVLDQWIEKTEKIDDELEKRFVVDRDSLTVKRLFDLFLENAESRVESGEIEPPTFRGYLQNAKLVSKFLGKGVLIGDLRPSDFSRLKTYFAEVKPQTRNGKQVKARKKELSLETVRTYIRTTKVFFNYAVDEGYLDRVPWTKSSFSMPSKKAANKQQRSKLPKQATRDEINAVLDVSGDTWKAMILLALNSGGGNSDVALLRWSDVKDGWVETPRSKTSEARRFQLWPETVSAIELLPKQQDELVFHGRQGADYIPKGKTDQISRIFTRLARKAGVKRENLSFYSLRHTFQNVADESLDFPAVHRVMGHAGRSIADGYRGKISDERLSAVSERVRQWMFPGEVAK